MTIEPRASGIAATASATAKRSASNTFIPWIISIPNTRAEMIRIPTASLPEKRFKLSCKGVFFSFVLFISVAILPISVFIPVSVTQITPRP